MTNVARRVYRTIRFETIVTDDDDCIDESVRNEMKQLENISVEDLIKNTMYDIVSDEVDEEYVESWEDDDEEGVGC